MKEQFTTLLQTEMDRRSFLKYMAVAGIMTMGGGVFVQSIIGANGKKQPVVAAQPTAVYGFGSGVYGGNKV